MSQFQGFFPETIDFLWGIRFNNNREWFAEHKGEYQHFLLEPMKALAANVAQDYDGEDGSKLHISRIYKDMRMHPTTFYKESLWFCLRKPGNSWLERPCLCFEVRPEGYRYGFIMVHPKAATMEAFRIKLADHGERFLSLVRRAEKESGLRLDGDRYARPKPCEDASLAPYFGMKNLYALRDCAPDELLYSADLEAEVRRCLKAWKPVYDFCQDL